MIKSTGKLLDYKNYRYFSECFIETGSAAGDGIQRALVADFQDIRSCEGEKVWFNICATRFKDVPRVTLFLGETKKMLPMMLPPMQQSVVFLDAHPAGPLSFGHADLMADPANSEYRQDQIIKSELQLLAACGVKHLIIIDDVNGLADGFAEQYCEAIGEGYEFFFFDENLSGDPEFYYKEKLLVAIPK